MAGGGALGAELVVGRRAQRRPGGLAVADQGGELGRLQAEGGVRAAVGAGQREVLLDDRRAQRHRRHRRRRARRVVGEPGHHAEARAPGRARSRTFASSIGAG